MLINGVELSSYGGQLMAYDISTVKVEKLSNWMRGSLSPTSNGKKLSHKKLVLNIVVEGSSEDDTERKFSTLANDLEETTIYIKALKLYYDVTISDIQKVRQDANIYTMVITLLSGFAYEQSKIFTLTGSSVYNISVGGNSKVEPVIKITVPVDTLTFTVMGYTVKDIKASKPITINSKLKTVTELGGANRYNDFSGIEFPKLNAGSNTVSSSLTTATIEITYEPRWL